MSKIWWLPRIKVNGPDTLLRSHSTELHNQIVVNINTKSVPQSGWKINGTDNLTLQTCQSFGKMSTNFKRIFSSLSTSNFLSQSICTTVFSPKMYNQNVSKCLSTRSFWLWPFNTVVGVFIWNNQRIFTHVIMFWKTKQIIAYSLHFKHSIITSPSKKFEFCYNETRISSKFDGHFCRSFHQFVQMFLWI